MQLTLRFADGCTGDDDEVVAVIMPLFIWGGLRVWIMHGGTAEVGSGRWELQERLRKREGEMQADGRWLMTMHRSAAQWAMVYFEIVGEARFVLRQDLETLEPIREVTFRSNRVV